MYDADIKVNFDSIDHEILMGLVGKRIVDGYVLKPIRAWLRAGIVENDMRSIPDRGTPQGGVWGESDIERRNDAHLIRNCDDFIVLSFQMGWKRQHSSSRKCSTISGSRSVGGGQE